MGHSKKRAKLAKIDSNREWQEDPEPRDDVGCLTYATSANQDVHRPVAHDAVLEFGQLELPALKKGINVYPDMAFLVRFNGAGVRLFAPSGENCDRLSQPLSLLHLTVCPQTARKYVQALRRLLDAGAADRSIGDQLFASFESARQTIGRLLLNAGCHFQFHQLRRGSLLVTAPEPLIVTVDIALTTLSHCYDLLRIQGELGFDNPIQNAPEANVLSDADRLRRPSRYYLLANKKQSLPRTLDMACADEIYAAAVDWPAGIAAAADLMISVGARPDEILALNCRDWAASDFGDTLACQNKGSGGARTKQLFIDEAQRQRLKAYVDGPRCTTAGIGIAGLRTLHRHSPDDPALSAPLFVNTRGTRISYSLFNDYYFRPSLRALGSAATPCWARHERTTKDVVRIRDLACDPIDEERMLDTYASIRGWASGRVMVDYYSASLSDADQRALLERLRTEIARDPMRPPASISADPPIQSTIPTAFAAFLAGERR